MAVRILHCGSSVINYELCINEKVAGFISRSAEKNDLVYLAVKINGISYCGARGILNELTDIKPWPDADRYVHCFTFRDLEFCNPFDVKILSEPGGPYWPLKYLQGAKKIEDKKAISILDLAFKTNKAKEYIDITKVFAQNIQSTIVYESNEVITIAQEEEEFETPEEKISIMGTFQTINFYNETNKLKGLECLVNENFYPLFPQFPNQRTLLIPENRMFKTSGHEDYRNITGIRGIPDGILIVYNKDLKNPIQINLIEYECYGEKKIKITDKSNYFNGQIIPL